MKRIVIAVLWSLLPASAWADRILVEKSTDKLIEYQSDARPGTLIQNIERNPQYGYTVDQVEEREISRAEWLALYDQRILEPERQKQRERAEAKQQKANQLRQKLGFTPQEFEDLREAVSD